MKKLNCQSVILSIVSVGILALLASPGSASDVYISQNSNGSTNSLAWLNLNWNSIQPGDTVHLVGTFTNTLIIARSGLAGNPLTILFEKDAKFSAPTWPPGGHSSSIIGGNVQYLVIDGGQNGLIEATDNGWQKSYSNNFDAIGLHIGAGVEIKNLSIINLNPRRSNNVDNATCAPTAIFCGGTMKDFFIHNCNITNVGNGIVVYPQTGISTNIQVYSNNVFGCSWGVYCESASGGSLFYDTHIWRNHINNGTGWDGYNPGPFHQDGIIVGVPNTGSTNYRMKIYWNIVGPDSGYVSTTSALYWETTQSAMLNVDGLVFGNVFMVAGHGQQWNSGMISVNGSGFGIYNNTFGVNDLYANATAISVAGGDGSVQPVIENNLIYHAGVGFYLATISTAQVTPTNGLSSLNYNYFALDGDNGHGYGTPNVSQTLDWGSWFAWYAPHADETNNIIIYADPTYAGKYPREALLNTDFSPRSTDTVVVGKGTNLTALADALGVPELKLDINGNSRPPTGPWTIGAFEIPSTSATMTAPNVHNPVRVTP